MAEHKCSELMPPTDIWLAEQKHIEEWNEARGSGPARMVSWDVACRMAALYHLQHCVTEAAPASPGIEQERSEPDWLCIAGSVCLTFNLDIRPSILAQHMIDCYFAQRRQEARAQQGKP